MFLLLEEILVKPLPFLSPIFSSMVPIPHNYALVMCKGNIISKLILTSLSY